MARKGPKELVSDQGYRLDGRKPNELRRLQGCIGVLQGSDGSAYLEQGNTKILALVHGPHEVRGIATKRDLAAEEEEQQESNSGVILDNQNQEDCIINVQWKTARFSHAERKATLKSSAYQDRIGKDWGFAMQDCIKSVLLSQSSMNSHGRTQIDVHIHVLQYDGGVMACAINAVTLALMDAGIPMLDFLVACHGVLYQGDTILLDASLLEESEYRNMPLMTLAMHARTNQVTLMQMMGPTNMPLDKISFSTQTIQSGAHIVYEKLKEIVQDRNSKLWIARKFSAL
jgi:exosome complex component RRP41